MHALGLDYVEIQDIEILPYVSMHLIVGSKRKKSRRIVPVVRRFALKRVTSVHA